MSVEGSARSIRDNLRFVEDDSKVEGFEVCERVAAKEAQLFVERYITLRRTSVP
jgi:hypothetical protein